MSTRLRESADRRKTPWRRRAEELLADGQWHDMETVAREAARVVPAGRAFRLQEQMRAENWLRDNPGRTREEVPPRSRAASVEDLAAKGARRMAMRALRKDGFERDGGKVRLAPWYLAELQARPQIQMVLVERYGPGEVGAKRHGCVCPERMPRADGLVLIDPQCPYHGWDEPDEEVEER